MKSELETLVSVNASRTAQDETAQEINSLLRSGIDAAKNGNREEAKALLFRVTDIEPENEMAWLWLASVSEYPEELLTFLQKVLHLNPQNEQALEWEKSTKALLARNLVQYGITAVQENKKESAKRCFLRALETDVKNEMAWLWLASITDVKEEKIANLEKVLGINPNNEVANTLLKLLHKDEAQALLQKSRASAVHGNRREALEMLEQVKQLDAELDEVWILQAHLSESFEEKAFCFNQALACNPANEVARVGLASLESILQSVNGNGNGNGAHGAISPELMQEVEAFAPVFAGESEEEIIERSFAEEFSAPEDVSDLGAEEAEENDFAEESFFAEENVEEPPSFAEVSGEAEEMFSAPEDPESEAVIEEEGSLLSAYSDDEPGEVSTEEEPVVSQFEEAAEDEPEEEVFAQAEENEEEPEEVKAETFYFGQDEAEEEEAPGSFESDEAEAPIAEAENVAAAEDGRENYSEVLQAAREEEDMAIHETIPANMPEAVSQSSSYVQMSVCPFCAEENNINDEVCGGCHAVLGLHNMDLLFAHDGADSDKLSEAIENMEANLESDVFTAEEYFNLGLACLNLRNLDSGLSYLQKSYILNPTNSFLKSQIDELNKRMDKNENEGESEAQVPSAVKTVMVVDDSATIRKLVSAKLEKHGHNVVTAVDGMDALAKLEEIVPDLILLDITMPRLDGYQVCKLIRANENTRFVPVVLISGKDGFFDKVRGKMCGSTTYITKPFGPEMLLRTVEAYFQ